MQYFQALTKINKHFDFLINPKSFIPKDTKKITIRNQEFQCTHYEEKGVNRFDNISDPQKSSLFTYYCESKDLQKQLEIDFDNTYQKIPFDPSSIILPQNEQTQPTNELEVNPEDLHIDHAVIFKQKTHAAQYEVEDRIYYVK